MFHTRVEHALACSYVLPIRMNYPTWHAAKLQVPGGARFTEEELVSLTLAVANINSWNRLSISFRAVPGAYQPSNLRKEESDQDVLERQASRPRGGRLLI